MQKHVKSLAFKKESEINLALQTIVEYQNLESELDSLNDHYKLSKDTFFKSLEGKLPDIKNFTAEIIIEQNLYLASVAHTKENFKIAKDFENAINKKRQELRDAVQNYREYKKAVLEEQKLQSQLKMLPSLQEPTAEVLEVRAKLAMVEPILQQAKQPSRMNTFSVIALKQENK